MRVSAPALAVAWLIAALPGALRAQMEPAIEIPPISFSEEAALPEFRVGAAIDIHLDDRQIAQAGGGAKLHARIVRGSRSELAHRYHYVTRDGCLFYRTAVYSVTRSARGIKVLIVAGGPDLTLDVGWLSRDPETVGQDQTFVLILERKAPYDEVLKLRPQDAESYFATGLEFVVKANRRLPPEEQRELIESGRVSLASTSAEAEGTRSEGRCHTFSKISVDRAAFVRPAPCPAEALALTLGGDPCTGIFRSFSSGL